MQQEQLWVVEVKLIEHKLYVCVLRCYPMHELTPPIFVPQI